LEIDKALSGGLFVSAPPLPLGSGFVLLHHELP
jgi:hypothetical protein